MRVILKTTDACNAACAYCSAWDERRAAAPARLDDALVGALLEALAAHAAEHPREPYGLTWHGGEPLLLGVRFYEQVQRRLERAPGDLAGRLRCSFQTNLLALDARWLPVLRAMRATVGTSFDPIEGPTTAGPRVAKGRRSYRDRWLRAFGLLRRAAPEVSVGAVYVVHRGALGRAAELYAAFRDLGLASVRFNPLYPAGRAREHAELAIAPVEYGDFLLDLHAAWETDGRRLRALPVAEWVAAAEGRAPVHTCDNRGLCAETHLSVGPTGAVSNCGRFTDSGWAPWGQLGHDPLPAILAHPERRALANRTALLANGECAGCPWWELCAGGCPHDAWLAHGDPWRRTGWCEGRRRYFAGALPRPDAPAAGECGGPPTTGGRP
jgi:uncharacterized protein